MLPNPSFSFALASIALNVLFKSVRGDSIRTNTPLKVVQCQPVNVSWTGGTPPYYIYFNSTASVDTFQDSFGGANLTLITGLGFGNIYENSFTTLINFQTYSQASFQVTDSKNLSSTVSLFTVVSGDNDSCVLKFIDGLKKPANSSGIHLAKPIEEFSCGSGTIDWTSGVPPFTLAVRTFGLSILEEQIFSGLYSVTPYVQIQFPPGVQVKYAVRDSIGQTDEIGPLILQRPAFTTSCVINNITSVNTSIPFPTTELPFPASLSGVPAPSPTSSVSPSSSDSGFVGSGQDDNKSLSHGALAGIVVGVLLGLGALVSFIGVFLASRILKRRQRSLRPFWLNKPKAEVDYLSTDEHSFISPLGPRRNNVSTTDDTESRTRVDDSNASTFTTHLSSPTLPPSYQDHVNPYIKS